MLDLVRWLRSRLLRGPTCSSVYDSSRRAVFIVAFNLINASPFFDKLRRESLAPSSPLLEAISRVQRETRFTARLYDSSRVYFRSVVLVKSAPCSFRQREPST